jgi:hypothetical protein
VLLLLCLCLYILRRNILMVNIIRLISPLLVLLSLYSLYNLRPYSKVELVVKAYVSIDKNIGVLKADPLTNLVLSWLSSPLIPSPPYTRH